MLIDQIGESHDTLIVLNPSSGQRQEFFAGDYPGIDDYPHTGWGSILPLAFDRTLTRLVYPKWIDYRSGIALWDVATSQEITFFPIQGRQHVPQWSPDGQEVIVSKPVFNTKGAYNAPGDLELFRISREGEIQRLTYLSEYYDQVDIGGFHWSPDGRYIGFDLDAQPFQSPDDYPKDYLEVTARLAVYDTVTQTVTNYCVPSWGGPIWSPDSQRLLTVYPDGSKFRVYLVDIQAGFAVQIAEDALPGGWMAAP